MTTTLHGIVKEARRHKTYGVFTLLGVSAFALAWGMFFIGMVATQ